MSSKEELPSTPSSDDSQEKEARRSCNVCRSRMSSLHFDMHSLCSVCRGGDCSPGNKCKECLMWSKEEFEKYFKHKKALESKNRGRKKAKESKNDKGVIKGNQKEVDLVPDTVEIDSSKSRALVDNTGRLEVAQESGAPMSRAEIASLVSQIVGEVTNSVRSEFASSLSSTFVEINNLLDKRLGVDNPSFPGTPSQALVHDSLELGSLDPPLPNPRSMSSRHGGEEGGPEPQSPQPELAQLPPSLISFLADVEDRGIQCPRELVDVLGLGTSSGGHTEGGSSVSVAEVPQVASGLRDAQGA